MKTTEELRAAQRETRRRAHLCYMREEALVFREHLNSDFSCNDITENLSYAWQALNRAKFYRDLARNLKE